MILAIVLCIAFGIVLSIYINPMEDISLDLSLTPEGEGLLPEDFDDKGWTVYTREGEVVTELTLDGLGSYLSAELGQTFYFSRVLSEELDDPTLRLYASEYTFAVFLDNDPFSHRQFQIADTVVQLRAVGINPAARQKRFGRHPQNGGSYLHRYPWLPP